MPKPVRSTEPLRIPDHSQPGTDFDHADLQFHGVDHSGISLQVRVFLNNDDATAETPTDEASGYAGTFHIFGHGGCFGGLGHCDVRNRRVHPYDYRLPHRLESTMRSIEVTDTLKRLRNVGTSEVTVTLVPIPYKVGGPVGRDVHDELRLDSIGLVTYETSFDESV